MPKLHLKRTPAEEAERQRRKLVKASRRASKLNLNDGDCTGNDDDDYDEGRSRKRRRWDEGDELEDEDEIGPSPPNEPGSSKRRGKGYGHDHETLCEEVEERMFREKMLGAVDDDERLDGIEARLNDFAHVPDRWRSAGGGRRGSRQTYPDEEDEFLSVNPQILEDEAYAEWVRIGMWRKTHAEEHAERLRKKAQQEERSARERELRDETRRQAKVFEAERDARRRDRERRRAWEARDWYDYRWTELTKNHHVEELSFADIPWPITHANKKLDVGRTNRPTNLEDLKLESISSFLLGEPPTFTRGDGKPEVNLAEKNSKDRREKLREAMLRFHPDKFEGRMLKRVRVSDKDAVLEGVGMVARALNLLLAGL